MTEEARTFISDLVWNDGNFMTLFTADYGYVSTELAGIYKVKGKRIIPLYKQVLLLKTKFSDIEIRWIPRGENKEADRLTNIAYNKALQENPEYLDKAIKEGRG